MDRFVRVTDLLTLDGGNCRCVEASYPPDLTARVNAQLAAWAAAPDFWPYVQGWEIGSAGAGGPWRAIVELGRGDDWGFNTSVPAGLAHFICREAQHVNQLTAVQNEMLTAIAAATTNDGVVVGTKIAGPRGNGSYLIAMLYIDEPGLAPTIHVASPDLQENLAIDTVVAGVNIPGVIGGNLANRQCCMIHYAMEVADDVAAGTGVEARLNIDAVPTYVEPWAAIAPAEFHTFSGHHYCQQTVAPIQFTLEVHPGAGNTVSVRQIRLDSLLIIDPVSDV